MLNQAIKANKELRAEGSQRHKRNCPPHRGHCEYCVENRTLANQRANARADELWQDYLDQERYLDEELLALDDYWAETWEDPDEDLDNYWAD